MYGGIGFKQDACEMNAMMEYQIEANTRRCAATGRELKPGEKFYSVLADEDGKFVRKDYSEQGWQGPPENAFSFWSGKVPSAEENRRPRIDSDVLADCFHRLEGDADPGRVNFRYVLALLLMRAKRFKFEEARVENGQETLALRCIRTRALHQVQNPRLKEEEMRQVQEEVFKVLGWE
jgi:hypothetical protein